MKVKTSVNRSRLCSLDGLLPRLNLEWLDDDVHRERIFATLRRGCHFSKKGRPCSISLIMNSDMAAMKATIPSTSVRMPQALSSQNPWNSADYRREWANPHL